MCAAARSGAFQRHTARSASLPSSLSASLLDDARRCSAPPPRAARRSNRLLCVLTVCLHARAGSCVVLAVRRCKGGDGGAERSRGGRLFEVTEIATTDDKMPMEEMLKNIAWCSTGVLQTETFEMFQPMYGSTDRCSSARSP